MENGYFNARDAYVIINKDCSKDYWHLLYDYTHKLTLDMPETMVLIDLLIENNKRVSHTKSFIDKCTISFS